MKDKSTLESYIREEREKGFSDSEIKKMLLNSKHKEENISKAFSSLGKADSAVPKEKSHILPIVLALIIIAAAVYFGAGMLKGEEPYTPSGEGMENETAVRSDVVITSVPMPSRNISSFDVQCEAIKKGNLTRCYDDPIIEHQVQCINRFYSQMAFNTKDESYCESINRSFKVFEDPFPPTGETDDVEICKSIVQLLKEEPSETVCYTLFSDDVKVLKCIAELTKNCDKCYEIKETESAEKCYNDCKATIATEC